MIKEEIISQYHIPKDILSKYECLRSDFLNDKSKNSEEYSDFDIEMLVLMMKLRDFGFSFPEIKQYMALELKKVQMQKKNSAF